jgi:hypothetical protein
VLALLLHGDQGCVDQFSQVEAGGLRRNVHSTLLEQLFGIVVGSTAGDPGLDSKFGPLPWNELSRDALVASHFSRVVGVYSLEGCVHQGFLPRLRAMDWGQTVTIPAEARRKVMQLRARIQAALWTGSHLGYFAVVLGVGDLWLIWRRHWRNRAPKATG